MTRQYIGARYVPRFMGTYDNTQIYEALDVVDNGSGTSYIARKIVPAGTALTNTDYWFVYGASSGAIINLQNQIDAITGDIGDMDDLETPVTTDLVESINSVFDIARRMNRKFIFISDSYGTGEGPDGPFTSWIDRLISLMGLTTGVNAFKNAYGGTSWKGLNGRKSFETLLTELDSDIDDKEGITDIIVAGGVNDSVGTINDGLTGISGFKTYVKVHYPNARVYVALIGWSTDAGTRKNILDVSLPIYKNCGFGNMTVLNLAGPILHDYGVDFQSDGVHPNDTGNKKIAWTIAGALFGGDGGYYNPSTSNHTLDDTMFDGGNRTFTLKKTPQNYTMMYEGGAMNFKSGATWPGWHTPFVMGNLTGNKLFWNPYNVGLETSAEIGWNDGHTHITPCTLCMYVQNNVLYGVLLGDTTITPSNLVYLRVGRFMQQVDPYLC